MAPTSALLGETISTLQFADRAKSVMLKVRANAVVDDKAALARANEEIKRLQNLLSKALAKLEGADDVRGDADLAAALGVQAAPSSIEGFEGASVPSSGSNSGVSNREMTLLQENAQLVAENERLRSQLQRDSQGNKENRQGHVHARKRQSQSSDSTLASSKQYSKSSNHHMSISALANRNNSYFAERDRVAGNFQKMHKSRNGASVGSSTVRVYGSTSSAKLVKSLKAELKADSSKSPKRSLHKASQELQQADQAQYFSGFASAVIAQATGQALNPLEAKKTVTLERLNGQVRLNSAEALERFHKREMG